MYKNIVFIFSVLLLLPTVLGVSSVYYDTNDTDIRTLVNDDLDPFVDVSVTVDIKQIRTLEKTDLSVTPIDKIDRLSDPDFYVKVFINDEEFISPTWYDTKYVDDPQWSATVNVPDDVEWVNITIQLWDANPSGDVLCDLSGVSFDESQDDLENDVTPFDIQYVDLQYNIKTGHWTGGDGLNQNSYWSMPDVSGYGRLNGCDDGSIYQNDLDCELWFDIYQNDHDSDDIPYWTEVNVFGTDPSIDDRGRDDDGDGVPIEWEWKWGYYMQRSYGGGMTHVWQYHPFIWDDHMNLDTDNDGLSNYEEYLTGQWGSDPFRKDLFVELDQMEAGPNGEDASVLPERSKELLRTAYNRYNIVYHLDDGCWENSGSDMIPFDEETTMSWGGMNNELIEIYNDYFLHGDEDNWRGGVFHYGVMVYQCTAANGNAFGGNRYQISYKGLSEKARNNPLLDKDIVFASAYMHECGHTLDIINPGVDDQYSKYPWQLNWWKWRPYKSVMNYGYMFLMVDYSDGSRGKYDFDDWNNLDLTAFQRGWW